jgi:hypothetical protein
MMVLFASFLAFGSTAMAAKKAVPEKTFTCGSLSGGAGRPIGGHRYIIEEYKTTQPPAGAIVTSYVFIVKPQNPNAKKTSYKTKFAGHAANDGLVYNVISDDDETSNFSIVIFAGYAEVRTKEGMKATCHAKAMGFMQ